MTLFITLILFSQCSAYIKEGNTYELIGEEHSAFLKDFRDELRVILFFSRAQMTGNFNSDFFQVSKEFIGKDIKFGKIDIVYHKNNDIKHIFPHTVPHIMYCLAKTDTCHKYKGSYSKSKLADSLKNKLYHFETFQDIDEFDYYINEKNKLNGIILGIFENFSSKKYEFFLEFAQNNMDKYKFAIIKDEGEWTFKFNLTAESVVVAKGKFLQSSIQICSHFSTASEIEKFVNNTYHPYISYITEESYHLLKKSNAPFGIFYINFNYYFEKIPYLIEKFNFHSQKYITRDATERKYQWAIADTNEFTKNLTELGLQDENLFILIELNQDYYKIDEESLLINDEFNPNCLENFYNRFEHNRYPIYRKSQPLPRINFENRVRVAVGITLERIIENKDIIHAVFVYDSRKPTEYQEKLKLIEQAADEYRSNFIIEFIKIDSHYNYIPINYRTGKSADLFFATTRKLSPSKFLESWKLDSLIEKIEHLISKKTEL